MKGGECCLEVYSVFWREAIVSGEAGFEGFDGGEGAVGHLDRPVTP